MRSLSSLGRRARRTAWRPRGWPTLPILLEHLRPAPAWVRRSLRCKVRQRSMPQVQRPPHWVLADGILQCDGDRVLVAAQRSAAQNGVAV